MSKEKFYITTSIAYANSSPHIGFALELVQADVLARHQRLQGKEVFFLTGTDEHGVKIIKAAQNAGKPVKQFVGEVSVKFRKLAKILNLSNNDFIRTTDQRKHWPSVKRVWRQLQEAGDLYKKKYQGLYCEGCEAFKTKRELIDSRCIIHKTIPGAVKEENYFFKLSRYQDQIERAIQEEKLKIIPEGKKNEMLSFISQGLEDVSFSRPRKDLKWGIPVPNDSSQTIYVWADALVNYLSILGYDKSSSRFKKFWPANVHCIGKDILRFHATIWPGMLLSAGLSLPETIFVHGFITSKGQKMSKSLGNIVDPFGLANKYGSDAVRYFLLKEVPSSEDGDFTPEKFVARYNSDLANGLGNLASRVIALAAKLNINLQKADSTIPNSEFQGAIKEAENGCKQGLDEFKFNESLGSIWQLIGFCDKYIEEKKPWQESTDQKKTILNLLYALNKIADFLTPFLPETSGAVKNEIRQQKKGALFPRF